MTNFLVEQIECDLTNDTYGGRVVTRFPPEPNGYLHIGHAKAILTDFGLASQFGGRCHLRMDDTNPTVEDTEFVQAIQRDVEWLGCDWGEHLYYASDYFPKLYAFAQRLIREGKAYVCSLSEDEIREWRGSVTEAGRPSPDRDRPADESLRLLDEMRRGVHPDSAFTLRAKIDMSHQNMKMRDPLMYRIRRVPHHRTGDSWNIYPMYDFAHGLSDAIEGVTHSICTLEFENNRELYDWFVEQIFEAPVPRQYEFARFNMTYIVTSKRKLKQLVEDHVVHGWDDPRMPTIAGLRNRGVPPSALRALMERVGLSRTNSMIDWALFEHTLRDTLNEEAPRRMGVLRPLPVTITNWPEHEVDWIAADEWPHDVPKSGSRNVPFTKEIVIDRDDFAVTPPKGWRRVTPGVEVRLRYGYYLTITEVIQAADGTITRLEGTVDLESRGGTSADGRKVKGTVHWASASHGIRASIRMVDRLFSLENPDDHPDGFLAAVNPDALQIIENAVLEPSIGDLSAGARIQLERVGYFHVDESQSGTQLTRIVPLKDSWNKPETAAPKPEKKEAPETKAPARKRTRKSASEQLAALLTERPELAERLKTLTDAGASDEDASVVATNDTLFALYEQALGAGVDSATLLTWLINIIAGALKDLESHAMTGEMLAELIDLVDRGEITQKVAKSILPDLLSSGGSPSAIIDARGLRPIRDPAVLGAAVDQVIAAHDAKVAQYRDGKTSLRGFFVGQVMRATGGKADPKVLQQVLTEALDG